MTGEVPVRTEEELTSRELEIVRLTAADLSIKEIAARLGLAQGTVKAHRCNISEKLGGLGIAGLTMYAVRNGLVKV